ncbi:MAG: hypothetical protein MnENMB40S_20210 [Rhizobiaceae bacterium MnEN-MB40S]|nr:MAG: hypothetical protein MnENMB40S_20210 [Rhizobiaceae bacterium MnEN-MB40S]
MIELADELPPGLARLVRKMVAVKLAIGAVATIALPITFTLVVIFRYFLHADLFAYEEWLLPIAFWLYFLGSSVGSYQDGQIRADILETYLKTPKIKWWRRLVVGVLETAILIVLVFWAGLTIMNDLSTYPFWQTTIALNIPYFIPHLAIFVGFAFMAFYSALHLYVLLKAGPDPLRAVPDEPARTVAGG